jgi:hypothetical protein
LKGHVAEWQHPAVRPIEVAAAYANAAHRQVPTGLGARIWYALHCLPRDQHGMPPATTPLEEEYDIDRGILKKLISGVRENVEPPNLKKIAKALGVTVGFLAEETDVLPQLSGPPPPPRPLKWQGKDPLSLGTILSATGVALDRLGIGHEDVAYLVGTGEKEMHRLPAAVKEAAFAAVYMEGCPVEVALQAALDLFLAGENPELGKDSWLQMIRRRIPERKQSGVRRITSPPAVSEKR